MDLLCCVLCVEVGGKPPFMLVEDQMEDMKMLVQKINIDEVLELEKVACNIINTFSDIKT